MAQKEIQVKQDEFSPNWQAKTLALGGVLGASVGLLAAYLLVKNSERTGNRPEFSTREGMKIGVLLFGVVRSIANLWED
jgi:hypothetical protein